MDTTLEFEIIGVVKKDCWFNERGSGDGKSVIGYLLLVIK